MKISIDDIVRARERIKNFVKVTDLEQSMSASQIFGTQLFFKYENTQFTGSFKLRGALNKVLTLSDSEKKNGVVASSAGNHAQGVAFSATRAGVKSTIVMPLQAPLIKVSATRDYGAEVVLHGQIYDEAYDKARELEKEFGYTFVHPFEDEAVIAGQGTIGVEIHEKVPDFDTLVVPIGGGGLISGITTVIKHFNPKCRIIGVQSIQAPGMERLFHQKNLSETQKRISTIADGIAIKRPSQVMYDSFISKLVDEIVTVSDDEIAEAMVFLLERAKTVTEGAGAAGFAAVLSRQLNLGAKTCVVLCGGNIDLNIMAKVIDRGQIRKGRLAELSMVVDDLPGNLSRLTKAIADLGANILEVHHDRVGQELFMRETKINFVLETTGPDHIQKIKLALEAAGAKF